MPAWFICVLRARCRVFSRGHRAPSRCAFGGGAAKASQIFVQRALSADEIFDASDQEISESIGTTVPVLGPGPARLKQYPDPWPRAGRSCVASIMLRLPAMGPPWHSPIGAPAGLWRGVRSMAPVQLRRGSPHASMPLRAGRPPSPVQRQRPCFSGCPSTECGLR